jgi:addiction module RelE/StbE family toxin
VRLVWSRRAQSDLARIYSYIEAENPEAAMAIDSRIVSAALRLVDFPQSGRPGRVAGTRELVVLRTSYIAAYAVKGDTIRILRVLHGAQTWPKEFSGR